MTQLLDSVQLYLDSTLDVSKSRVWINSGIQQPTADHFPNLAFSKDAYIPQDTWQELSSEQSKTLITHRQASDYSRTVGIFSVPDHILAPLRQLNISQLTPDDNHQLSTPEYGKATEPILTFFKSHCNKGEPTLAGIGISWPNLPTVTINPTAGHYIGLHLDSWDRLPLQYRHQSTNRICINLGESDRHFLFINLTLIDMLIVLRHPEFLPENSLKISRQVQWKGRNLFYKNRLSLSKVSPLTLKNAFAKRYPNYPVIKVRISPGEAYIAPTENILHEGSTLDQNHSDVQLTIRGHFKL
ncbi:MAG: hypothetical protein AAGD25_12160 [Cyanobacteria bacterium P01_F01_bin.150]